MRLSFESKSQSRFGSSYPNIPKEKYGVPKVRRCLNCEREMTDDGTALFLRGFCSDRCRTQYLNSEPAL